MVKRIVWTKPALEDKLEILIYWNKRNKSNIYSQSLNRIFKEMTKLVRDQPSLGRDTEHPKVKYIIVRDYFIFFEIAPTEIVIEHIWDTRRNPSELKFRLK
ncbi:MAG: type II toxin-antitoxin system RelE/ParE family toxin [Bacteroidetes bacterium]|nr:type II toxin-antitoxin system RelE/ParE family toxin [Bacteroidota bacterium]